jgi:UPF0755 protein
MSDREPATKRRKKTKPRKRRRRPKLAAPPSAPPLRLAPPKTHVSVARWTVLGAALLVASAAAWLFVLFPSDPRAGEGRSVEVVMPPDPNVADLASRLVSAGVISSPRLFALWVWATGGARNVIEGVHLLTDDASPREVMARLERRGFTGSVRVTLPEGWTRFEIARRLQDKRVVPLRAFLDATTDEALLRELGVLGDSAEGFLFPATYDLALDSDARDVVRRLKREFDRRWDIASRGHSASLTDVMTSANLSIRDVVTLASMIEKEAAVDDERPLVASVFLNRLRDPAFRPKHLECDPTASYGCLAVPERAASCAGFTGKATAAIEHDPGNPYSTYTHEGMPPGPIANPGSKSLDAAMAPALTRYFFFVAKGDGRHTFSETYDAHVAAVRGPASHASVGSH